VRPTMRVQRTVRLLRGRPAASRSSGCFAVVRPSTRQAFVRSMRSGGHVSERLEVRRSSRLVILDPTGRMLLFRYQDEHTNPFWATVGGELGTGEDFFAAAQRELLEETGFRAEVGPVLRDRDAVYAVARSSPARWLEKYFLVQCHSADAPDPTGWTDEERSTIQAWKWWSLTEMLNEGSSAFRPEFLPELLRSVLAERESEPG